MTLQEVALRVLTWQGNPPPHAPPPVIRDMVFHRQSEPYRLRFARVLGALRWRAIIHRCTCPISLKFVVLDSVKEHLPRFNEYWRGYTLTYEPLHWCVSIGGNGCIGVNLD